MLDHIFQHLMVDVQCLAYVVQLSPDVAHLVEQGFVAMICKTP